MDESYEARPAPVGDLADVLAVTREVELATIGEPLLEAEDLAGFWRDPTFDPARDSRLVRHAGRPVAMAAVFANGFVHAAVAAAHRGRGVGTALADWAEARQRERGLRHCDQEAFPADEPSAAFLLARGYVPVHESWSLELPADARIAEHRLPAGVEVRPMRPGEERAVHRVVEDAFSEWEGRSPRGFESWSAQVLERPERTADHLLVAARGDEVVGACVAMDGEDPRDAWVAQLAVRREHRGQGIAQQLLAVSYAAARRRGRTRGRLDTDSRTGALGLYERLGMQVTLTFRTYRREL